ncbi:MAG: tRNA (N6-isopentenyl adenosine(37)-C2)-methylthiotransferase MiaB [Chitinophagaceae bacterium]
MTTDKKIYSFYIESYGCQMNFADSEVIVSILLEENFKPVNNFLEADLILINTCSVREKAEQTVRARLLNFKAVKKQKPNTLIAILGCMAERLKTQLLEQEKLVDIVAGPDAYRSLPQLIVNAEGGQKAVNVLLSREETYAEISPVRIASNGVSAFVSIMRGCNNMCSFCVVPFTRGRERSRDIESILTECKVLIEQGYKEVTLLGQNVDSYYDKKTNTSFAILLKKTAQLDKHLRVRFSTSHPKDITDEVLHVIAEYDNICKYIHLPVQSGSTRILQLMNRNYTRDWYLEKIQKIQKIIPQCAISTDIITGFCTETEQDHQETLSLMDIVQYDYAYTFAYSERPQTVAEKNMNDDVPSDVKLKRLNDIIDKKREYSLLNQKKYLGQSCTVLIEGESKKSKLQWKGRNSQNQIIVFEKTPNTQKGDYVKVEINSCTGATFLGTLQ